MSRQRRRKTLIESHGSVVSRRAFLRGSLLSATMAGTGALAGCMTPPLPAAAAPAPGPGAPPVIARGPAISRNVPKAVARYQNVPNGRQRCGRCVHFLPPGRCKIVAGAISPQGWCRFFEAMA
jgi:hypothetical protein